MLAGVCAEEYNTDTVYGSVLRARFVDPDLAAIGVPCRGGSDGFAVC